MKRRRSRKTPSEVSEMVTAPATPLSSSTTHTCPTRCASACPITATSELPSRHTIVSDVLHILLAVQLPRLGRHSSPSSSSSEDYTDDDDEEKLDVEEEEEGGESGVGAISSNIWSIPDMPSFPSLPRTVRAISAGGGQKIKRLHQTARAGVVDTGVSVINLSPGERVDTAEEGAAGGGEDGGDGGVERRGLGGRGRRGRRPWIASPGRRRSRRRRRHGWLGRGGGRVVVVVVVGAAGPDGEGGVGGSLKGGEGVEEEGGGMACRCRRRRQQWRGGSRPCKLEGLRAANGRGKKCFEYFERRCTQKFINGANACTESGLGPAESGT